MFLASFGCSRISFWLIISGTCRLICNGQHTSVAVIDILLLLTSMSFVHSTSCMGTLEITFRKAGCEKKVLGGFHVHKREDWADSEVLQSSGSVKTHALTTCSPAARESTA